MIGIVIVNVFDRAEADVLPRGQVMAGEVLEDHCDTAAQHSGVEVAMSVLSQAMRPASGR